MNRRGRNGRGTIAHKVALGGVLSAMAIVILLAGGFIPIGTFAAPIFAGICLLPIAIDVGVKWAILCYVAVSALAVLMVPDLELILFFIVLLGWYPIFQPVLLRLRQGWLRTAIKLLMFNASVAIVYSLMLFLFTSAELSSELATRGWWFWAALLVVANITFALYDILLGKVRIIYFTRLRRHIFR